MAAFFGFFGYALQWLVIKQIISLPYFLNLLLLTQCKEIVKEEAPSSSSGVVPAESRPFGSLRGVQWRINLGILPPSSSIDDLRRVTADFRRRYAGLRRQLLVDPHVPKDGATNSLDLVMDNPLSQNPDSTWSQYFRNAELEKMVNQDLSRLYPEHESYFHTPGCQGMLRRILLLWYLRHPDCGYRQGFGKLNQQCLAILNIDCVFTILNLNAFRVIGVGMHELLAPLLYVLHVDVERLLEVRKLYEDLFIDKFDGFSFEENGVAYNFDFKKFADFVEDEIESQGNSKQVMSLYELDPELQSLLHTGLVISYVWIANREYEVFQRESVRMDQVGSRRHRRMSIITTTFYEQRCFSRGRISLTLRSFGMLAARRLSEPLRRTKPRWSVRGLITGERVLTNLFRRSISSTKRRLPIRALETRTLRHRKTIAVVVVITVAFRTYISVSSLIRNTWKRSAKALPTVKRHVKQKTTVAHKCGSQTVKSSDKYEFDSTKNPYERKVDVGKFEIDVLALLTCSRTEEATL
ncbi:hypothetical protein GOBAR_AA07172 [Gossypium barbadense]|uniref:Rab-GAP TBC domain-containing protein n=1 Tax=Gossypium barbadense TaxID=3634 RepID=A0A2P5YCQ1_GOSBA|nr:hypothetical protein GOBAR_AA07172 [Gossypium barbadense]